MGWNIFKKEKKEESLSTETQEVLRRATERERDAEKRKRLNEIFSEMKLNPEIREDSIHILLSEPFLEELFFSKFSKFSLAGQKRMFTDFKRLGSAEKKSYLERL